MENQPAPTPKKKLLIVKEVLRELNPKDLVRVAGGRTDVSNACCNPTDLNTPTCPP